MDRVTTILRTILALMAFVYLGAGSLAAAGLQSSGPVPSHESDYQAPLDRYCATCHNEQLKTGGLVLRALDVTKAGERPEVWEKVVKKLRTGAMPPVGMPRPDKATYDLLATYVERQLDQAAAARPNLYLTLLDHFGVDVESFGDSTGKLEPLSLG